MTTAIANLPPLESGDRLSREEFHRRYSLRPDITRAELVDGVVYVASPTRWKQHDKPNSDMITWLKIYAVSQTEVEAGGSATIRLGPNDEVQPDGFLFRTLNESPRLRETDDDYLEGAPELVVEVAASSASYDLHQKKEAYRRAGVLEYIVWQVYENRIDWFVLRGGAYVPLVQDKRGVIESYVFPGLRLPVAAMLAGDIDSVLRAVRRPRKARAKE